MNGLLIDENLPGTLELPTEVPIVHARSLGIQLADDAIWRHARERGLVILTKDADFFDRLILEGAPPSVVWLRVGNMRRRDLDLLLARVWPKVEVALQGAALIEVYEDRIETLSP